MTIMTFVSVTAIVFLAVSAVAITMDRMARYCEIWRKQKLVLFNISKKGTMPGFPVSSLFLLYGRRYCVQPVP